MLELDFNERELYWIAVDIANNFGKQDGVALDKLPLDERVKWVSENLKRLNSLSYEAESKHAMKNAMKALGNYARGEKVSHMVYLDASNQALQLYAILTADLKTAKTCNIAGEKEMADAYQILADAMNLKLRENNIPLYLTRTNCKKALMTTMYGKSDGSIEIMQDILPSIGATDKLCQTFASTYKMQAEVSKMGNWSVPQFKEIFQESLIDIAPKAVSAMTAIIDINAELGLETYYWTMPDGFKVRCDIKVEEVSEAFQATVDGFNIFVPPSTREIYRADSESRSLAPNLIHSIDGYIAREMVRRMDGKFITTIHDAFGCHPRDCDLMRTNYNEIMVEILESNLLQDLTTQILGTQTTHTKTNDLTSEMVLKSGLSLS